MNNGTNARWSTLDRFWLNFTGGKFRHVYEEAVIGGMSNPGFMFKFEADGYAPVVTRAVGPEEAAASFDVALNAAESKVVTVLLPDGRPASGADIGLVSPEARLQLIPGGFSRDGLQSAGSLIACGKDGQFELPPDDAVTGVVAAHGEGFASVARLDLQTEPVLRLQAWGRLEGSYVSGEKAVAGRELYFEYGQDGRISLSTEFRAYRVTTDENGRFAFPQVPPGKHRLVRLVQQNSVPQAGWLLRFLEEVEIRPGETTQVTVGGSSYNVTARLRWPQELKRDPSWKVSASIRTPSPLPPESAMGNAQALAAWRAIPEVKAALTNMRHFPLTENVDGTFSVEDVPAGEYRFSAAVFETPGMAGPMTMHARAEASVTVPSDPPSGTVDLGEVVLKPAP